LRFKLINHSLFLVGTAPAAKEVVERGVFLAHGAAGVILQRFGDQPPVRAVILHALGDDIDGDFAADDVLDAFFTRLFRRQRRLRGWQRFVIAGQRWLIGRDRRFVTLWLKNLYRVAIEVRTGG
jgi:hypothetical protein